MAQIAEAPATQQRVALEELLEGVRQEGERMERLEQAIREAGNEDRGAMASFAYASTQASLSG